MRIVAPSTLRTGSVTWQETAGQWTLTVVCKATFILQPGVMTLAPEPEDVVDVDNHWDDDPDKPVYAASDLAPFKRQAEVMLVGSAFAPAPGLRSVVTRLLIGDVDKSVEVSLIGADGAVLPKVALRADRSGRGFGPIACSWPVRQERLRGRSWSERSWQERPLGEAFDALFFQAAPPDQRFPYLRSDEALTLENLHPAHGRLVTRLPSMTPRARVSPSGGDAWDLDLVADTLWIDTDRSLCAVTWRAELPLAQRFQQGEVHVSLDAPSPAVDGDASSAEVHLDFSNTAFDAAALDASSKPPLPFTPASAVPPSSAGWPQVGAPRVLPALFSEDDSDGGTRATSTGRRRGAAPAWLPERSPVADPLPPSLMRTDLAEPPLPTPRPAPSFMQQTAPDASPWSSEVPPPMLGVLDASNAAADPPRSTPAPLLQPGPASVASSAKGLLELVWFEPKRSDDLRKVEAWIPLVATAAPAEDDLAGQRRDMAAVLASALPTARLDAALLESASEKGMLEVPLVVVTGDIELPLDDAKMLEAMLGAATPLAANDKRLKELVDFASEVRKTPLGRSGSVAAGLLAQLREAWGKTSRALALDTVETSTRRLLLEERAYQMRGLWDAEFVRALLHSSNGAPVPAYVPASAARRFPLQLRFAVRLLAEVHPQQDHAEASGVALRVVAVARVLSPRSLVGPKRDPG